MELNTYLKGNPEYFGYNFLTKSVEVKFKREGRLPKSITSIYNENAVRFVIEHVESNKGGQTTTALNSAQTNINLENTSGSDSSLNSAGANS
jgi:hypothetical protein